VDDYWRHELVKGKVHDENAYMLGGVAGHAGLFSTAEDISKVMFTLLNDGKYKGKQIYDPKIVETWTTKQTDQSTRGLGWDTIDLEGYSSAGHSFSKNSFGHTGFTGTSVWADKDSKLFIILLTNRVYPTRKNRKISQFRPVLHNTIYDILKGN
jgi:CubicO group peptidase (beta-lactamase class C family)